MSHSQRCTCPGRLSYHWPSRPRKCGCPPRCRSRSSCPVPTRPCRCARQGSRRCPRRAGAPSPQAPRSAGCQGRCRCPHRGSCRRATRPGRCSPQLTRRCRCQPACCARRARPDRSGWSCTRSRGCRKGIRRRGHRCSPSGRTQQCCVFITPNVLRCYCSWV